MAVIAIGIVVYEVDGRPTSHDGLSLAVSESVPVDVPIVRCVNATGTLVATPSEIAVAAPRLVTDAAIPTSNGGIAVDTVRVAVVVLRAHAAVASRVTRRAVAATHRATSTVSVTAAYDLAEDTIRLAVVILRAHAAVVTGVGLATVATGNRVAAALSVAGCAGVAEVAVGVVVVVRRTSITLLSFESRRALAVTTS